MPQILNFLFASRFEVTYGLLRLCKGTTLDRYFHELLDKSYSGPFLPNHPDQIVSILFFFFKSNFYDFLNLLIWLPHV